MQTFNKMPVTLQEAIVYFSDPDRAFRYAIELRWPDARINCPRCNSDQHSFIKTRRLWFCEGCKKQFTLKVGTIFEDLALGLDKWMTAAWMVVSCKNGVSGHELARSLGITQKSAWFMLHRIREALQSGSFVKSEPVSRQLLTWLIFWPLLTLIAGGEVYFKGPAKDGLSYQAVARAQGGHYYVYVNLLMLLGFAIVGHRSIWSVLKRNPVVLALLLTSAASAFVSVNPVSSLVGTVELALSTVFACYLSIRKSSEDLMSLLMFMGVVSAALSIAFVVALPSYGIFAGYGHGAWQGICDHKNTLGRSMAFLLTPVFFTRRYSGTAKLLYGGLLLFLIGMSQSRGAWCDTAVMLLFVGWLYLVRRLADFEYLLLVMVTVVVATAAIVVGVTHFDSLTMMLGKDPTMNGRVAIYREVWASVLKHPFLGYGYGKFWKGADPESFRIGIAIGWMNIGYAESGILELALHCGMVAVGLLFAMIGTAIWQSLHLVRSQFYSPRVGWFLTVIVLVAMVNIDAGWPMTPSLEWTLTLIACIGLSAEARIMRNTNNRLAASA